MAAGFLLHYQTFQKEKGTIQTLQQLDLALENLRSTPGTFHKELKFARQKKIDVGCGFIRLDKQPIFWDKIVFAPSTLQGKMFTLAHAKTELGIDVYYLTKPDAIYPVNDPEQTLGRLADILLEQNTDGTTIQYNSIFYDTGGIPYIDEQDAVGGVIVTNQEAFTCRQKKILKQTLPIIETLTKKAQLLQTKEPQCLYQPIITSLKTLQKAAESFDVTLYREELTRFQIKEQSLGGCPSVR